MLGAQQFIHPLITNCVWDLRKVFILEQPLVFSACYFQQSATCPIPHFLPLHTLGVGEQ